MKRVPETEEQELEKQNANDPYGDIKGKEGGEFHDKYVNGKFSRTPISAQQKREIESFENVDIIFTEEHLCGDYDSIEKPIEYAVALVDGIASVSGI